MPKRYVLPGERVEIIAPHSEVCMHMQVAGKPMLAEILPSRHAAQLFTPDGREYSAPITPGEAGFYSDEGGFYVNVDERRRAIEIADWYWSGLVAIQEHHGNVQRAMLNKRSAGDSEANLQLHRFADCLYQNWLAWAKAIDSPSRCDYCTSNSQDDRARALPDPCGGGLTWRS